MKKGQIWVTDLMITFFLMVLMVVSSVIILNQQSESISTRTELLDEQASKITRSDELIHDPDKMAKYSEDQRRVIPQTVKEKELEGTKLMSLSEAKSSSVKGVRRLVFSEEEVKVLEVQ